MASNSFGQHQISRGDRHGKEEIHDDSWELIRREVLDAISLTSSGALINAELLVRARRAGFTIAQAGVSHHPRLKGEQTGANPAVIARMFREVFGLWLELKRNGSPSPRK